MKGGKGIPMRNDWSEYTIDTFQRSVLFMNLLRERGNQQAHSAAQPAATVLRFDHEVIRSGHSLPKPINYFLSRIVPPPGIPADPQKRPVVVVDPRAGQCSGIGGFKAESEIGDALAEGHPVYFIGFTAKPEPGQQFLDVVEGQVAFFERVVALHPDSPRPFAIGNCQAGYQTLMVAMLRPDLFGPVLVPGSPMSYWQGVHGKNPMRYLGGLLGGSWLTALANDMGKGKFDGAWLVMNFDSLNPANWLWSKQYDVYANVDTDGARYLEFEKWWGDFVQLSGDELQFLVDNLFVGDKLARNQMKSTRGVTFDLRNVTSPIIVFTSEGDNISPPQQTLGWILDLYRNVDEIRATGRTIVYCVNDKVGHLAIFVSSKVGAKEDEEFVQMMDVIDCLPPGLFEMVIEPRPAGVPAGSFVTGNWIARFEARSLDDIRKLGRNSDDDDRAFAAAARLSEINHTIYRTFMQPLVRALATQPLADAAVALNPIRLSYTLFSDERPWMRGVNELAGEVAQKRRPAAPGNPFLALQNLFSQQMIAALDLSRAVRDAFAETAFFGFYGSPFVQSLLGVDPTARARELPELTPQKRAAFEAEMAGYRARVNSGGFDEGFIRAVLYVMAADNAVDQRSALALNETRKGCMGFSGSEFKQLVRDQFYELLAGDGQAVDAIATLVPEPDRRREIVERTRAIVGASGPLTPGERERLARLERLFGTAAGALPAIVATV